MTGDAPEPHVVVEGTADAVLTCENLAAGLPAAAFQGRRLRLDPAVPLVVTCNGDIAASLGPLHDHGSMPLAHADFVAVLESAGVDNVSTHPAIVRDARSGATSTDYRLLVVVGLVAAVDRQATRPASGPHDDPPAFVESLVLDQAATSPFLMFRLAERPRALVIAPSVHRRLAARFPGGLRFFGPGEWSG